jgi:hypothetical protein
MVGVGVWKFLREATSDGLKVSDRTYHGGILAQAAKNAERVGFAIGILDGVKIERSPELSSCGKVQIRAGDANYGEFTAIQEQVFADDISITGEMALPESVTENDDGCRSVLEVNAGDQPADLGWNAQEREKIARDLIAFDAFGNAFAG